MKMCQVVFDETNKIIWFVKGAISITQQRESIMRITTFVIKSASSITLMSYLRQAHENGSFFLLHSLFFQSGRSNLMAQGREANNYKYWDLF